MPSLVCLTLGTDLLWTINNGEEDLAFNSIDPVESQRQTRGYRAVLLGLSEYQGENLRTSILTLPTSLREGPLLVRCSNFRDTPKFITYQHTVIAGKMRSFVMSELYLVAWHMHV